MAVFNDEALKLHENHEEIAASILSGSSFEMYDFGGVIQMPYPNFKDGGYVAGVNCAGLMRLVFDADNQLTPDSRVLFFRFNPNQPGDFKRALKESINEFENHAAPFFSETRGPLIPYQAICKDCGSKNIGLEH
jgi:hypothetical protein